MDFLDFQDIHTPLISTLVTDKCFLACLLEPTSYLIILLFFMKPASDPKRDTVLLKEIYTTTP